MFKKTVITLVMLLLALPAMAAESTAPSAKEFLDNIYSPWMKHVRENADGDYAWPADDRVYVPELSALLKQDKQIAARNHDAPLIDWVVLCACQDDGAVLSANVNVMASAADTATAKIALTFQGNEADTLTMRLKKLPQGWRIADVADAKGAPSLLDLLRKKGHRTSHL